jgi:2-dehydropantoate 2-reductase
MKFLCFGAGAIGTYIGGSLALAGHSLIFIDRPETAAELQSRGLNLDLGLNSHSSVSHLPSSESVAFVSSLAEALSRGPFDAGLLATKSYHTAAVLEQMRPHADRLPPILCLQNGVENEPALAAVVGLGKVIAGSVTTAVGRRGVGAIAVEKLRGLGVAAGNARSEVLVEALSDAGLKAHLFPNAADMKWSKLLTNLLANASSAILDMSPATIFAQPGLFNAEMRMLCEALAVMRAQRIRVVDLPGTPVRALAWGTKLPGALARPLMARSVGGGRGAKMPSFYIDLHSGHGESEVDYLNGAVVRAGEAVAVPTPVNRFLTQTLLALTSGDLPLDTYAHQPEKLLSRLATA